MNQVKLNYNHGYHWIENNDIYVKGYLFDNQNKLYEDQGLLDYFKSISCKKDFIKKLEEANGIFSVIVVKDNFTWIAVDRTRTFPLFYLKTERGFLITDDTYFAQDHYGLTINQENAEEFRVTGYVTGRDTLLDKLYQVQAGEYVVLSSEVFKDFYFDYTTNKVETASFEDLSERFLNILDCVVTRLIKLANGKQIVLPLSGGYDSRLIAVLLKKYNYKNVFCFTYGSKDSFEVAISKKVANQLGYKWYFVEYNEETIPNDYPQSSCFDNYYKFAANHVSIFLTQDYFAVKKLSDNALIDKDAIIVPGHSGDFLGGSHLQKTDIANKENITTVLISKHYVFGKVSESLVNKLNLNIGCQSENFCYSIDENFNMKERQSKFIVNANRVYEFFGYKHAIPLWDKELVEFFKYIPLEYKQQSTLYNGVLMEKLFVPFGVGYLKGGSVTRLTLKKRIKNLLNYVLPDKIYKVLLGYIVKDFNNLSLIHNPIQLEVKEVYPLSNINGLLAVWYIKQVENEDIS